MRTSLIAVAVVGAVIAPAGAVAQHHADSSATRSGATCPPSVAVGTRRPVMHAKAGASLASFIDPSARIPAPARVTIGCRSYVAPFVSLDASRGTISIGDETDIQDNAAISGGRVVLGDRVIIAHGATIRGPGRIGARGGKAAFIGFNAYIDAATVEPDAFVGHLARIAPGVVIHAGTKVLPGKFVRTQGEADSAALGKVTTVSDADREFMAGVLHVNTAFATGYAALFHDAPTQVRGVGRDPGHSDFNHEADVPTFAGKAESHPELSGVRIIGGVTLDDAFSALRSKVGRNVAIRADEGEHFHIGVIGRMGDRVTFHALEHTDLEIGAHDVFGSHVVVHGGPDDGATPHEVTQVGDDVTVKEWAVVFRSKVGKGCVIGAHAYVDGSHLAPGTVVPDRAIMIKDRIVGYVEW